MKRLWIRTRMFFNYRKSRKEKKEIVLKHMNIIILGKS